MNKHGKKTTFLNFFRLLLRNRMMESLLIPVTRGKQWNQLAARIPANYYQYSTGSMRNVKRNGFHFVLDISDYMQWLIYFGIGTEPRATLYNLVQPGMHVLDIGANIGETTLEFSRRVGAAGKVISFEPFPVTFGKLENHIRLNALSNVTVVHAAAGNSPGILYMNTSPGNSGGNKIAGTEGGTPVKVITLDAWLDEHADVKPSLLKIDVEGFEMKVLEGAIGLLRKSGPMLFMEINPEFLRSAGDSAEKVLELLSGLGYELTDAENGNAIIPGKPLDKSHFDLIARKK